MKTLPQLLDYLSESKQDVPAIIDRGRVTSYHQFIDRSRRIASGLRCRGIEKGDRIGVWLPNIAAYLEFFFACAEVGAIAVSVNTKFKSSELADIVSRSGCKMLVLWPGFKNIPFLDILSEVPKGGLDTIQSVVLYTEIDDAETVLPRCLDQVAVYSFEDLLEGKKIEPSFAEEDDGLVIFTTSGTTGKPKFVLHSQRSVTEHACEVAAVIGYSKPGTRLFQANPLCGTFGLTQALAGLAGKAEVHCLPVFNAKEAVKILQDKAITDMNGSDDMYAMLLDEAKEAIPFPSLRQGGYAAFNPAQANIVERADKRGVKLVGLWGMSESQALFSCQDASATVEARKLAGGYLVSPSAKIRIVDPDTREILEHGERGEIEFRGPGQMKEYFGDQVATTKALTPDGFIRTGDLGLLESDQQFTFISRMGDVLRLGGFLTDPVEIEKCLQKHADIKQAQVVGVTSLKGPKAFAFITPQTNTQPDLENIFAHCKSVLAGYKIPIHLEMVETFPMAESANGLKIQRSKLREEAARITERLGL